MFDRNPLKLVYDIWHTPGAFGCGNLITIPQAIEARALLEERGQKIPNADRLTRYVKLRNLREYQKNDAHLALNLKNLWFLMAVKN